MKKLQKGICMVCQVFHFYSSVGVRIVQVHTTTLLYKNFWFYFLFFVTLYPKLRKLQLTAFIRSFVAAVHLSIFGIYSFLPQKQWTFRLNSTSPKLIYANLLTSGTKLYFTIPRFKNSVFDIFQFIKGDNLTLWLYEKITNFVKILMLLYWRCILTLWCRLDWY